MYELTGVVALEKGLSGEENMEELIRIFTQREANKKSCSVEEVNTRQEKITEQMRAIISDVGMFHEYPNRIRSLDYLAKEYIVREFSTKYDAISDELFELKRIVLMEHPENRTADPIKVEMPLFFEQNLEYHRPISFEKTVSEDRYSKVEVELEIPIPPITREAKEKAKQAQMDFLNSYSKALAEPILGEWLLRKGTSSISMNFNQSICWIPRSEDIKSKVIVIEKDPMIIARVYDHTFLVAKWMVEGELPFEHYLAEYKV